MGLRIKHITFISLLLIICFIICGCGNKESTANTELGTSIPLYTYDPNQTHDPKDQPFSLPNRNTWNIEVTISNLVYIKDEFGEGIAYDVKVTDYDNIGFGWIYGAVGYDYFNGTEWVSARKTDYYIPPNYDYFISVPQETEGKYAHMKTHKVWYWWDDKLPDGKYRYRVKLYDKSSEMTFYCEFEIVKEDLLKSYYENGGK